MILFRKFLGDGRGSVAVEYAMIAFLVSILIVAALAATGSKLSTNYYGPIATNLS